MDSEEFKKTRIEGREKLLQKILEVFKELNPVAIHQLGSGASGYKDELSDLDIWITFKDEVVSEITQNQDKIFKSIAPVLIEHNSKRNSPIGGSATLVIYKTEFGLFQVDYYISKLSQTVIKNDAKILFGDDSLPRGEWVLDKEAVERKTIRKSVAFLIVMAFISIKGVIRKWDNPDFENTIQNAYKRVEKLSKSNLKPLPVKLSFNLVFTLLKSVGLLVNNPQRKALKEIESFAQEVQGIYK